jgi:hypothetical protein
MAKRKSKWALGSFQSRPITVTPKNLRALTKLPQNTWLRAFKAISKKTWEGPCYPSTTGPYKPDTHHEILDANTSPDNTCGRGLNVSTLGWIFKKARPINKHCDVLYKDGNRIDYDWGHKSFYAPMITLPSGALQVVEVLFQVKDIAAIPAHDLSGKFRLFRHKVGKVIPLAEAMRMNKLQGSKFSQ